MTALWTANEAALATGGLLGPDASWIAQGVSIDTRAVAPDDLFIALKGQRFDGHDFVIAALSNGAAAAMIDHPMPDADPVRLLTVLNTQASLEALAIAARARTSAKVIAVTGSVGKTGTKDALAKLLSAQGTTHATSGNLNNQIGLPLSLARMPASVAFGVFEAGMNHAGEIAPLSTMLRPHVAIITNVEAVHLEYFANIEAIADAKAEIFVGMDSDGIAVLNRDNAQFLRLQAHAKHRGVHHIWSFGIHAQADARLISAAVEASGSNVEASILGHRIQFQRPLPGRHQVQNALAVLLGVAAVGGDLVAAAKDLEGLEPVKGRGVTSDVEITGGGFRLIDETYNASPASVRAALAVLGMMTAPPSGRRIVVLGDMLELGEAGLTEHAGLVNSLFDARVDLVFTAGTLMRNLHEALPRSLQGGHADHSTALAPLVASAVGPGDIVLVKGSAGSRMGTVVEVLRSLASSPMEARHTV